MYVHTYIVVKWLAIKSPEGKSIAFPQENRGIRVPRRESTMGRLLQLGQNDWQREAERLCCAVTSEQGGGRFKSISMPRPDESTVLVS